jgi:Tol biopolymer transport system component
MRFPHSVLRALPAAAVAAASLLAFAAPGPRPFVLASGTAAGGTGDGPVGDAAVTPSGKFVVFSSRATDLLGGGNNRFDVFLRDLKKKTTVLVSANAAGGEGDQNSFAASVSNNGKWVLFQSQAGDMIPGDGNMLSDVFLRDVKKGATVRVSEDAGGGDADGNSRCRAGALSGNGRYAVFHSEAADLVPGGNGGRTQVYLFDRVKGTVSMVSADAAGTPGDGDSLEATISANGRWIAFHSTAGNLVADPPALPFENVYVYDVKKAVLSRVSRGFDGSDPDGPSTNAVVSNTGQWVAFQSLAGNLTPTIDPNGLVDVHLADRKAGTVRVLSLDPSGEGVNQDSLEPSMAANGKSVAFHSAAATLDPADGNGVADVFLWDARTGLLGRRTVNADGIEGDGASTITAGSLSSNGKWLVVTSLAENLVPGLVDGRGFPDALLVKTK